jgi:Universal stress protein family
LLGSVAEYVVRHAHCPVLVVPTRSSDIQIHFDRPLRYTFFLNDFAVSGAQRSKSGPRSPATQPLTYANVVSFFKEAHLRATEVQPRCTIFFEGEWNNANIYDYCVIMVENSDQDVQVTFLSHRCPRNELGDRVLDSPFFSRNETQKLFGLLNSHNDVRGQNVWRFRDSHHWQPRHAEIFVFSFTPVRTQKG